MPKNYSEMTFEERVRFNEDHKDEVYNLCMTVWKEKHEKLREQTRRII